MVVPQPMVMVPPLFALIVTFRQIFCWHESGENNKQTQLSFKYIRPYKDIQDHHLAPSVDLLNVMLITALTMFLKPQKATFLDSPLNMRFSDPNAKLHPFLSSNLQK